MKKFNREAELDEQAKKIAESREFVGQIVNVVEDKFDDIGIQLENEDRQKAIEDGENEDEIAIIYGSDYGLISDAIEEILATKNHTANEIADAVCRVVAFDFIYVNGGMPSNHSLSAIHSEIVDVCKTYGIA